MRYFKSRGGHMSSLKTQRSIWSELCELLHTELNMKDASVLYCLGYYGRISQASVRFGGGHLLPRLTSQVAFVPSSWVPHGGEDPLLAAVL